MIKRVFFSFLVIFLIFSLAGCCKETKEMLSGTTVNEKVGEATTKLSKDIAIAEAKTIYKIKKAAGVDMSDGPCLSNDLMDDWVFDIAHSPRQEIDNEPENQCSAYREGKAHHFVEFDPEGNLIRAE